MNMVDLSKYDNSWYKPGNPLKRGLWYIINHLFLKSGLFPFSRFKVFLLRMFGAVIGKNVNIKPSVSIKYPWFLSIADNCWIGENVWIDNLAIVTIGSNVCISQGAYILCGNHNYTKSAFDLIVKPIMIEDGVWVGAKSIICPGVLVGTHSVLTAGSVATANLEAYTIYQGNPALKVKARMILP